MSGTVIDVCRNAIFDLMFMNLIGDGRAGHSRDGRLLLYQAAVPAYCPKLLHVVRQWMNEHGAVEFTSTAGDTHDSLDLQRLSLSNLAVQELIRIGIGGGL